MIQQRELAFGDPEVVPVVTVQPEKALPNGMGREQGLGLCQPEHLV